MRTGALQEVYRFVCFQLGDMDVSEVWRDFIVISELMSDRHLRGKRNSFIINLIETPHGLSIVQGTQLLNKQQNISHPPSHAHTSLLPPTLPIAPASKDIKSVFKKTNLIFHYRPQLQQSSSLDQINPAIEDNTQMLPWFDAEVVQKQEQKEIAKWYSERHRVPQQQFIEKDDFKQYMELYRKHRNYVIALYNKDYLPDNRYLSASALRKHLVCQAFWVMKIHHYLSSTSLINTHSPSLPLDTPHKRHVFKPTNSTNPKHANKQELLPFQLQTSFQDHSEEDQNKLLKRLTAEIRPYCDYCRIHCGLVWFQHSRSLDSKEIVNIMKNVNSKNPPLSQKEYEYILCVRCYSQNHFPLLLTHHDFKKVTLNDKLEPNRRKKNKKRKRNKQKREGEQDQEQQIKDLNEEQKSHQYQQEEAKKKEEVLATIKKLLDNQQQKKWMLEETAYLLELIEKYQQDWLKIHELLKKRGYCRNIETQDIVSYFLSLPRRGVSQLQEEYSQDEFIDNNLQTYTSSERLAEKKLEDCIILAKSMGQDGMEKIKKAALGAEWQWKSKTRQLVRLQIRAINQKLEFVKACQSLAKQMEQE